MDRYQAAIDSSDRRYRSEPLGEVVKSACQDNRVIITQVAHNYLPIFEIWYSYIRRFEFRNLLVIALDSLVYEHLKGMGINTWLLPVFTGQPGPEKNLWYETMKLRREINDMGIDYVHSDADAFWLRNPMAEIDSIEGDIVGSIAYGTPLRLVQRWGFVICCGFYLIRSTPGTRAVYDVWIQYTKKYGQDQNALNNLLAQHDIEWKRKADSSSFARCEKLDLDIHTIPERVVSRLPEYLTRDTPADVFHPYLGGGTIEERVQELKKLGIRKSADAR